MLVGIKLNEVDLGGCGADDENPIVIAVWVTGKDEKTGPVWRIPLGIPELDFAILEVNADLLAETDPLHIRIFLVSGIPFETFHKIYRLKGTHPNLIDLAADIFSKMKQVLVGKEIVRGPFANRAISEMKYQVVPHDLFPHLFGNAQVGWLARVQTR
jgi:hypothetical protein